MLLGTTARPEMEPARAFWPAMERLTIPSPPAGFTIDFSSNSYRFEPDALLNRFLEDVILTEHSPLYNIDHVHLIAASIGFLWTDAPNRRKMKRVVGEAEMPAFRVGRWQRARQEKQLADWFGDVPDFVITFDATYRAECSNIEFLALFEHELYHCGQAVDEFGFPKFSKKTGQPIFAMRGHDVEEFNGVVRRYGVGAAGPDRRDFVDIALQAPEIGPAKINQLCGACYV